MFDSYIPKCVFVGAGYDRSDEMSDVNNKIYAMDEESGDYDGLVGIKEGGKRLGLWNK